MRLVTFGIFVFSCTAGFAQNSENSNYKLDTSILVSYTFKSRYTKDGSKEDITNSQMRILFSGGFGGMPNFSNQKDKAFQKKYNVIFFSQGCLRSPEDDQVGYNLTVFTYLDLKYGTKWRSEIRQDAIGLMKLQY